MNEMILTKDLFEEQDKTKTITIDRSKSRLRTEQELQLIDINNINLAKLLEYEVNEEIIKLRYETLGLFEVDQLRKESVLKKYIFLVQLGRIDNYINSNVTLLLDKENLMYDLNYNPVFLHRGYLNKMEPEKSSAEEFLNFYKALILSLFSNKYSIEDILNSNFTINDNNTFSNKIIELDSLNDLIEYLLTLHNEELKLEKETKILAPKNKFNFYKYFTFIFTIISVAGIIFSFVYYNQTYKYEQDLLFSSHLINQEKYQEGISYVEEIEVDKIPVEYKYALAKAQINIEPLENEKKELLLKSLTPSSATEFYDYWIYLGRGNYTEAYDNAKVIGNKDLVIYCLLKEKDYLLTTNKVDAQEKQNRLSQIDSELDDLMPEEEVEENEEKEDSSNE